MRSIFTFAAVLLLAVASFGQKAVEQKTRTSITVEVENGKTLKLTPAELAKVPRREITAKDHDGKDKRYAGVELRNILVAAGAKLDKELRGPQLAAYVVIEAADGYHGVFGIAEIDSGFTDRVILLADSEDSKPLPDAQGPWQIIVPDDKKHGRWVRQVTAIRLRFVK